MTLEDAISLAMKSFPFPGYMDLKRDNYIDIYNIIGRYLNEGDKILDFGTGPMDMPAGLQLLGFKCAAFDDLQDFWHTQDSNREKIVSFAKNSGIDLRISDGKGLPFAMESFDLILALDVIEHLHDSPRELLIDLLNLVKPQGYLLLTVPNAVNIRKRIRMLLGRSPYPSFPYYYWYPGPWRGHIREYTKEDLEHLAIYLDLELLELRGCYHMDGGLPKMLKHLYRFVTWFFPSCRDTWVMMVRKKVDWNPKRTLSPEKLRKTYGLQEE
jgi:SAM-dependent methyltransferase